MTASLLANNGDVQIGTDATGVLCSKEDYSPSSFVRARNFNPFVWPDISTDDTPWWHKHGLYAGSDIPTGRRLEFDVEINQTTASLLNQKVQALANACQPIRTVGQEQELAFRWNGVNYVLYGRYRQFDFVDTGLMGLNHTTIRIRFLATDPVIYEADTNSTSIPVYTVNQTNYQNAAFSMITAANAAAAPPYINMGGDAPPRWTATINGPARNPVLMDCESFQFMWLAYTAGLGVFSGTNWQIDSAQHLISNPSGNNGGRYHVWPSHWLELSPGANKNKLLIANNVTFTGNTQSLPAGTTTDGTLQWRRGWWVLPSS